jgi:arylsulfatase A-like enzyme
MNRNFSRRDFLKLASLLPLGLTAPRFVRDANLYQSTGKQNVLVIVFDALSALNISFYGYGRETTPNLARLSERAIVYHNHYSGGNYTTTGTATLLTGTLPWTSRAFRPGSVVADSVLSHNIFNAFEDYYRIAYTHNGFANALLKQFERYMEELVPKQKLFLNSYDSFIHTLFVNDDDIATVGWTRTIDNEQGYSYSLFLSHLYRTLRETIIENIKGKYPRGIPSTSISVNIPFLQEHATEWLGIHLADILQPFFGYFHFLPPHSPFRTSVEFYGRFADDGFNPPQKPLDLFAESDTNPDSLKERTEYDEFILYADKAFGDLYTSMEESGLTENTWVVFTSDHGEMFERGIYGHRGPTLYEPVLRIPLLIFEPGRKDGMNIYTKTSAVDVLSTLLHVTGHKIPDWAEGIILPPYAPTDPDPNRKIYAMTAEKNGQYVPLTKASTTLIMGRYKLIYCFGYPKISRDEVLLLFDIESDPEELVDLYSSRPEIVKEMLAEMKVKLAEVDKPYL